MGTQRTTKPIPAIRGLPVVGSLAESNKDRPGFFLRVARECGDIGSYRLGPFTAVLLNASELVHGVLVGVTVICGATQTLSGRREALGDDEHDTETESFGT